MSSLKNDEVKLQVIALDAAGNKQAQIEDETGLPQSTISDFLCKRTYTKWWWEFEFDKVAGGLVKAYDVVDAGKADFNKKYEVNMEEPLVRIETTTGELAGDVSHLVIPDTQCKPNISLDYLHWAGMYIAKRKPDVIVHLGDHCDFESLSSYDKGKKAAEGKRVKNDIEASIKGMNTLLRPIYDLQQVELAEFGEIRYKPKMVLTLGNHEYRLMRHVDANPELDGFLSYDDLKYKESGWEVHDFLKPVMVNGVSYVHFMANPMSGKPFGGAALNVLKNVGESFTQGHKQTLDVATRFLPSSGKQQWAIIAGSYYDHDEAYKGYQGNHHWRGLIVKHNVSEGSYNPMFVDIEYLRKKYGK